MSSEAMQRKVVFAAFGGPETLQVVETSERPEPGEHEVRIRIEASSVQFTDTLIRRGVYPDVRSKPPHTTGYDFVGRVDAVGSGVQEWSPGDRVADLCVTGGNARWIVRPADTLTPVPEAVDSAEATSLVLSWMTALQALHRIGRVEAGHKVLVTGASGAVGLALVQLARLAGAEVYASASDRHHDRLASDGAIPLPRSGWLPAVADKMDICIDGICADGYRSPLAAVRRGGIFIPIGMSALAHKKEAQLQAIWHFVRARFLMNLWPDGKRVQFYNIAHTRHRQKAWWREDLGHLFESLEAGTIAVEVAEQLGFDAVAAAHQRLEAGGLRGKLVLRPWD